MEINYRKANVDDMPAIMNILNNVSGNIEDIDFRQFLIARDGSKIVGCVRIQDVGGFLELASLAVLTEYRKMGIGSSLIRQILGNTTQRPVYLFCNKKNEGFYNKFGFIKEEIENLPEILRDAYEYIANLRFKKHKLLMAMMLTK